MQHGAYGGCCVYCACGQCGAAVFDVPSHEEEWDMGIVGVPCSVGCTSIVVVEGETEIVGTQDGAEVA